MKNGFTLIELLVVIAIIGVLTSLVVVNFQGARERARDAQRKSDFRELRTALRLYYNDFQGYPTDNGGVIVGCGADETNPTPCAWGEQWKLGETVYMGRLPVDPLNNSSYVYSYAVTEAGENFEVTTLLENLSDPAVDQSQTSCGYTPPAGKEQTYVVCEN